ncbi:MAG: 30S ribosomal protein S4 [Candidatus Omnitrophica bacterium CG11_big_fil_rev_8_21_14_0_20_63_9]|nr:MAG: 30S ribosomal protein S4 [Candidatus Omnitrophica bacterium CG11_big_fil_rev_8_21_14_0_20_63_9]
MARYTGPACRLCRREGMKLFLKGTKCYTVKCPVEKRAFPPGQHGQLRVKLSDYGIQLREKQKVKRMYGVLERQFKRYFTLAQKVKGVTGQQLLEMLERRLDNVLYRTGFATSRDEGRMIVRHRGVQVNGRIVDIPSYSVKVGDVVQIAPSRKGQTARVKQNLERTKDRPAPAWIQVDVDQLKGLIVRAPQKDDIGLPIQEQLIVELYSK